MLEHRKPCGTPSAILWAESLGKPPFRSGMRTAGGRRKTLTMRSIAGGFPLTRPMARRIACPISSTYFHRRVTHLTALQALRLGTWSAVMLAHHKGRATTSEEPARPPEGSHIVATGGRHRRLTMPRIAGATLPTRWPRYAIICITLL